MMESWCLEWSVFVMTRADGVVESDVGAVGMTESWGLECSVFSRSGQRRCRRVRWRGVACRMDSSSVGISSSWT